MIKKYLRFKKDGYVIAWNEHAAANTEDYEEFTHDGNPHLPEFLGEAPAPDRKEPAKTVVLEEKLVVTK